MTDVDSIVAGLSEAQKMWLTTKAEFRKPTAWAERRWMTFPPLNTHKVLMRLGLVGGFGTITETGLAVRAKLEADNG